MIKFSTVSELLREDTFEAERLMELHTLFDYKERQLERLRLEEKELRKIIAAEKEILTAHGASHEMNTESLTEVAPLVERRHGTDIPKSNSARNSFELAEKPKIQPSGSAGELFDELKEMEKQPMRAGETLSMNKKPNHTFAQSRQNFFQIPVISNVLQKLMTTKDFPEFFKQFPLALLLVSGFYERLPVENFLSAFESLSSSVRQSFWTAFFEDMRKCGSFMGIVKRLMQVMKVSELTQLVEEQLVHFYSADRCLFLSYEADDEELVVLRDRMKLRFPVRQGIFSRALTTQQPVEAYLDDPEVAHSDRVIMKHNKHVFIMPVLSVRSQVQVDGLLLVFDKVDGIQRDDYLTTSLIARCISHIISRLRTLEKQEHRRGTFERCVTTYVDLCASSDLKDLVQQIQASFCSFFNCKKVRLFKVCRKKGVLTELLGEHVGQKSFPISTGILGSCVTNNTFINITKPQFSENYDPNVDCSEPDSFSSSLLVGVIPDQSGMPRWAIGLYNKTDQSSFAHLDEESLETICHHLHPLLESAWMGKRLKRKIHKSQKQLAESEALTDVIAMKSPADVDAMLVRMNKFFRDSMSRSKVILYIVDHFREELCNTDVCSPLDVIPLNSQNPGAECARTGRIIRRANSLNNTEMLFCPILDSSNTVIGVFQLSDVKLTAKSQAESDTNTAVPVITQPTSSSQAILNSFHSSLSTSRFLVFGNLSGQSSLETLKMKEVDNASLLTMIEKWQKVAGGVLEDAKNHRLFTQKQQLISCISQALFDNLFDNVFRVWQETQFLVDDFDEIGTSDAMIESPVITRVVYANTSELSEKAFQSIRLLQSLNKPPELVKKPRKMGKTFTEEPDSSDFLLSPTVDLIFMDEASIIQNILSCFKELSIVQYLGLNDHDATLFLLELRRIHPPKSFRSWRLAVDHAQFAAWLMLHTQIGKSLSATEIVSVIMYLLSLYSDPCATMPSVTSGKRTKFTLETGGTFSTLSSFFTACAWCETHIFECLQPEEKMTIWNTIDELELSAQIDAFLNASPALLITCIARYSHMMREPVVSMKWVELRMKEELPPELADDVDDVKLFEMAFEKESLLLPMLEEAAKIDPAITAIIERAVTNYDAAAGL